MPGKREQKNIVPKVLGLVSFRIYPTLMGGQKGVALFYRYLKAHCSVLLAVSDDNQDSQEVNTQKNLHPNKKIYLNISRLRKLKEMVLHENIDVVIAEHSYTAWMAWWVSRKTKKPFIIHSHNIESKRFRQMDKWWWRFYHLYESWIHKKAHHNFFISEDDRQFAIKDFKLPSSKCTVITYGVHNQPVFRDRKTLKQKLGLEPDTIILLFNGTLDYEPNYNAVFTLVEKIEPLLNSKLQDYKILVTGNRAPRNLLQKLSSSTNVVYVGYVEDVNEYYQSADLFLNPVVNDTGVKTKLIEAIANECTAVSTVSGASGIDMEICGDKLILVNDNDWEGFTDMIMQSLFDPDSRTPVAFYDHYAWENIAQKAAKQINELVKR